MQTLRTVAYAVTCGIITCLCVAGFWALLIVTP